MLKELRHDILGHIFDGRNNGQSVAKLKNNGLLRKKTTKEVIIEQKETRVDDEAED